MAASGILLILRDFVFDSGWAGEVGDELLAFSDAEVCLTSRLPSLDFFDNSAYILGDMRRSPGFGSVKHELRIMKPERDSETTNDER
jgi:hypothetical protein